MDPTNRKLRIYNSGFARDDDELSSQSRAFSHTMSIDNVTDCNVDQTTAGVYVCRDAVQQVVDNVLPYPVLLITYSEDAVTHHTTHDGQRPHATSVLLCDHRLQHVPPRTGHTPVTLSDCTWNVPSLEFVLSVTGTNSTLLMFIPNQLDIHSACQSIVIKLVTDIEVVQLSSCCCC